MLQREGSERAEKERPCIPHPTGPVRSPDSLKEGQLIVGVWGRRVRESCQQDSELPEACWELFRRENTATPYKGSCLQEVAAHVWVAGQSWRSPVQAYSIPMPSLW